jgi:hypothetical protein
MIINQRFCLKSLKGKHNSYHFYKGVDIIREKWVHIYIKQVNLFNKIAERKHLPSFKRSQGTSKKSDIPKSLLGWLSFDR